MLLTSRHDGVANIHQLGGQVIKRQPTGGLPPVSAFEWVIERYWVESGLAGNDPLADVDLLTPTTQVHGLGEHHDRRSDDAGDAMLKPRTRTILQAIRLIGSIVVGCGVVVIWMKPNPYVWWAALSFVVFGLPAAIATMVISHDDGRRKGV